MLGFQKWFQMITVNGYKEMRTMNCKTTRQLAHTLSGEMGMMGKVAVTKKSAAVMNAVTFMTRTRSQYVQTMRHVVGVSGGNATTTHFQAFVNMKKPFVSISRRTKVVRVWLADG